MDARGFDALTLALASAWSRRALLPLAGTLIAPGFGRADRASAARRRHRHCPAGTTRCGRACVDLATDHDHCGACAVACAPDATCQQGGCVTGGPCIFLCVICHACRAGRCEPEPDGTPCGSGQVCLAGACGPVRDPAPCAATGPSGIAGQVLLGPMCPVQQLGHPCPDQPFAAMLRIEDPAGRLDCTTRSGEDGTFRAALPPGDYLVAPVDPSPESPPHGRPERVTVALDQYVAVTIHFDSGIR